MNSKKCFSLLKMRGIGLLELMLSLSIIAILLIMATRYYLVTSFSQKLNQATTQITQLQAAAYAWKGTRSNYAGTGPGDAITDAQLISAGLIAQGDISNSQIVNPWGKRITVGVAPDPNYVTIHILSTAGAGSDEARACQSLYNYFNGLNGDTDNKAVCSTADFQFTFH